MEIVQDNWVSLLNKVDPTRIMRQIEQLAEIGRTETGGVTRLAFSHEDKVARDLLITYMEEAGLQISRDPIGNIIGRMPGSQTGGQKTITTGSHIDSVVNGGKFDGVLGVLASIECARIIRDNIKLFPPVEVICFVMEESSRFGSGYGFGSRVMAGIPISDEELRSQDSLGKTLAVAIQELKREETGKSLNFLNDDDVLMQTKRDILDAKYDFSKVRSFIELHIEQGPVLEKAAKNIGIVTSVAAPTRFRIIFTGDQNHSGTTPMHLRQDALAAAAEAILHVERISKQNADKGIVGTVGVIQAHPGAINVIPGRVEIGIDIRGTNEEIKTETIDAILRQFEIIGEKRSIDIAIKKLTEEKPITISTKITDLIERICIELDLPALKLPSGAGHDAAHLSRVTEAGLIFVPSINGISHDPRERTTLDDIKLGTQVLLATLLRLAS